MEFAAAYRGDRQSDTQWIHGDCCDDNGETYEMHYERCRRPPPITIPLEPSDEWRDLEYAARGTITRNMYAWGPGHGFFQLDEFARLVATLQAERGAPAALLLQQAWTTRGHGNMLTKLMARLPAVMRKWAFDDSRAKSALNAERMMAALGENLGEQLRPDMDWLSEDWPYMPAAQEEWPPAATDMETLMTNVYWWPTRPELWLTSELSLKSDSAVHPEDQYGQPPVQSVLVAGVLPLPGDDQGTLPTATVAATLRLAATRDFMLDQNTDVHIPGGMHAQVNATGPGIQWPRLPAPGGIGVAGLWYAAYNSWDQPPPTHTPWSAPGDALWLAAGAAVRDLNEFNPKPVNEEVRARMVDDIEAAERMADIAYRKLGAVMESVFQYDLQLSKQFTDQPPMLAGSSALHGDPQYTAVANWIDARVEIVSGLTRYLAVAVIEVYRAARWIQQAKWNTDELRNEAVIGLAREALRWMDQARKVADTPAFAHRVVELERQLATSEESRRTYLGLHLDGRRTAQQQLFVDESSWDRPMAYPPPRPVRYSQWWQHDDTHSSFREHRGGPVRAMANGHAYYARQGRALYLQDTEDGGYERATSEQGGARDVKAAKKYIAQVRRHASAAGQDAAAAVREIAHRLSGAIGFAR